MLDGYDHAADSTAPPPSYSPSQSPRAGSSSSPFGPLASSGFPAGYFLIKSVATGRLLDVMRGDCEDGTDIILWSEKEKSLVEGMRDRESDNQVFFLDYTGALCSKVNGLPIDVEENRLVVRHHRPITLPFPNGFSHPLPRFSYDQRTGIIRTTFACDPSYPSPSWSSTNQWREKDFVLTSVPLRAPKSFLATTADFFTNAATLMTFNPFGSPAITETRAHVDEGSFDLREDEVLEEERAPEDEDDDSPSHRREVRLLSLPVGWMDSKHKETEAAAQRRRWQVIPLLHTRMVTKPRSPRVSTSSS
ncbi:hypothetical protein FRC03_000672 [Tulasnella sp. 419]|nr:hypothetical protein FRC03_000672 [Tulasnella sp. 419]